MIKLPLHLIFLFMLLFSCSSNSEKAETIIGKVVGVKDGDTIVVLINGRAETVRLQGIDCPEKSQAFGKKAKMYTSLFCFGKEVTLNTTGKRDRYKRILAEVLAEGRSLNEALVKEGLAWHYTKYSNDKRLAQLEDAARNAGLGLWAETQPVPPWEFRKTKRNR
jgi:endonuclease YncB( thermonuclease family)